LTQLANLSKAVHDMHEPRLQAGQALFTTLISVLGALIGLILIALILGLGLGW
jgi:hypothetical protein